MAKRAKGLCLLNFRSPGAMNTIGHSVHWPLAMALPCRQRPRHRKGKGAAVLLIATIFVAGWCDDGKSEGFSVFKAIWSISIWLCLRDFRRGWVDGSLWRDLGFIGDSSTQYARCCFRRWRPRCCDWHETWVSAWGYRSLWSNNAPPIVRISKW